MTSSSFLRPRDGDFEEPLREMDGFFEEFSKDKEWRLLLGAKVGAEPKLEQINHYTET